MIAPDKSEQSHTSCACRLVYIRKYGLITSTCKITNPSC